MPPILIGLFIAALGAFVVAGAFSNWDWWWNNRRAVRLSSLISQTGARVFYAVFGFIMAIFGILVALGQVELKTK